MQSSKPRSITKSLTYVGICCWVGIQIGKATLWLNLVYIQLSVMLYISLKFCLKSFCRLGLNNTAKHKLLPAIKSLRTILIKSLTYFDVCCWMGHWKWWLHANHLGTFEQADKHSTSSEPCSLKSSIYCKSNTMWKHA